MRRYSGHSNCVNVLRSVISLPLSTTNASSATFSSLVPRRFCISDAKVSCSFDASITPASTGPSAANSRSIVVCPVWIRARAVFTESISRSRITFDPLSAFVSRTRAFCSLNRLTTPSNSASVLAVVDSATHSASTRCISGGASATISRSVLPPNDDLTDSITGLNRGYC